MYTKRHHTIYTRRYTQTKNRDLVTFYAVTTHTYNVTEP